MFFTRLVVLSVLILGAWSRTYNVRLAKKSPGHPLVYASGGSPYGYKIDNVEAPEISLLVGKVVHFIMDVPCTHAMYFTRDRLGGVLDFQNRTRQEFSVGTNGINITLPNGTTSSDYTDACDNATLSVAPAAEGVFYYQSIFFPAVGSMIVATPEKNLACGTIEMFGLDWNQIVVDFADALKVKLPKFFAKYERPKLISFALEKLTTFSFPMQCVHTFNPPPLTSSSDFQAIHKNFSTISLTDMAVYANALMDVLSPIILSWETKPANEKFIRSIQPQFFAPFADACYPIFNTTTFDGFDDMTINTMNTLSRDDSPVIRLFNGDVLPTNYSADSTKYDSLVSRHAGSIRKMLLCHKYNSSLNSIKAAHANLGISNLEFDAFVSAWIFQYYESSFPENGIPKMLQYFDFMRDIIVTDDYPEAGVDVNDTFVFTVIPSEDGNGTVYAVNDAPMANVTMTIGQTYKFIANFSCSYAMYFAKDSFEKVSHTNRIGGFASPIPTFFCDDSLVGISEFYYTPNIDVQKTGTIFNYRSLYAQATGGLITMIPVVPLPEESPQQISPASSPQSPQSSPQESPQEFPLSPQESPQFSPPNPPHSFTPEISSSSIFHFSAFFIGGLVIVYCLI